MEERGQGDFTSLLPVEVLLNIVVNHLYGKDVLNFRSLNKTTWDLVGWRDIYSSLYGIPPRMTRLTIDSMVLPSEDDGVDDEKKERRKQEGQIDAKWQQAIRERIALANRLICPSLKIRKAPPSSSLRIGGRREREKEQERGIENEREKQSEKATRNILTDFVNLYRVAADYTAWHKSDGEQCDSQSLAFAFLYHLYVDYLRAVDRLEALGIDSLQVCEGKCRPPVGPPPFAAGRTVGPPLAHS